MDLASLSWLQLEPILPRELIWGLVPRAIGLLYVIAFASLGAQAIRFSGSQSPSPASERFGQLRTQYPRWLRFRLMPTLLWIHGGDTAIRLHFIVGAACGVVAMVGGPWTPLALCLGYVCYLSIDSGGLSFPWDQLALEAAIVGALLPAPMLLPSLDASAAPLPLTAFAVHFLIARLMLGFAKVKFIGSGKDDRLYLKSFYVWMPMPNALGLWVQRLPDVVHVVSLRVMFVSEVICPVLILFPGWPRVVGGLGLVGLMLAIQATGNWGFFNIGYVLLCIALLDTQTHLFAFDLDTASTTIGVAVSQAGVALYLAYSLLLLVAFNSWVSRAWAFWPIVPKLADRSRVLGVIFAFLRQLSVLRMANAYGVFPPKISPAVRLTPVFEGSDDGVTWKRYRYHYLPSAPDQAPPLVAPHHPRFDQAAPYLSGGFTDESLLTSLTNAGSPIAAYQRYGYQSRLMYALVHDADLAARFFGVVPTFEGPTPKMVRVQTVALANAPKGAATPWLERDVGTLFDPIHHDDEIPPTWDTAPENIHPDLVFWKARAIPLKAVCAAYGNKALADVLCEHSTLTPDDVTRFFEVCAPILREGMDALKHALHDVTIPVDSEDSDPTPPTTKEFRVAFDAASAFHERFSIAERIVFERILDRAAWLLRERLLPHYWRGAAPAIERQPTFRLHLVCQQIVLRGGLDALEAALHEPASVVHLFKLSTDEVEARRQLLHQLTVPTLFRPRHIAYMARVFRWNAVGEFIGAKRLPSILEYFYVLRTVVPAGEVWCPAFPRDDRGWFDVESAFADEARLTSTPASKG